MNEELQAVTRRYQEEVLAITIEEVAAWPNGSKLIGLARALCNTIGTSYDADDAYADRLTLGQPGWEHARDVKRTLAFSCLPRPAWYHFLNEAKVALQYLGCEVTLEKGVDFMAAVREACKS